MTIQNRAQEQLLIDDPETLKVVADSLRLEILRTLRKPRTVKELAAILDIPQTKLYYHVNLLEKHGLIRITETHVVSGIIEKVYQITARHIRIDETALLGGPELESHLGQVAEALFDSTKQQVLRAAQSGLLSSKWGAGETDDLLSRAHARLRPEQLEAFGHELRELIEKFDVYSDENEGAESEQEYGLFIAFYPIPRHGTE